MLVDANSHSHEDSDHDHAADVLEDPAQTFDIEAVERTAEVFKALATPSRLRILLILTAGESTVSHIVEQTGLSQPLVSQHLKLLRSLKLVSVNRVGREAIYSFKDDHVSHIILDALAHSVEAHD